MVICQYGQLMLEALHIIIAILVISCLDRHHVYVKAQDPGVEFSRHVFVSIYIPEAMRVRMCCINVHGLYEILQCGKS